MPLSLRALTNRDYRKGGTKNKYSQVMRNVEEANHILYGCIVIGSNPILTPINRKPLRVSIVKRLEGSYWSQISATFATGLYGNCPYLP